MKTPRSGIFPSTCIAQSHTFTTHVSRHGVQRAAWTDVWLVKLLNAHRRTLRTLSVPEAKDYVLGLNSRVNQYAEEHIIMLDFDDISSLPAHHLKGEPGFFFRTQSGFHFIGSKLYSLREWKTKMRRYSRVASKQHFALSMKRGYATLRLTPSSRKPVAPAYIGRSG